MISDVDAIRFNGRPWHPQDNPARIGGLPEFANAWLNQGLARGLENAKQFQRNPAALRDAWLSAVPTALFFLVPVFALLLRLAYLFSPWTWLEHLVVALYRHSFILLASAVLMLLSLLAGYSGSTALIAGADTVGGFGMLAIIAWLFVAQWRVYRQGWWRTLLKFVVIAPVYGVLVGIGAVIALAVVFVR